MILKIVGLILTIAGAMIVYLAGMIVRTNELNQKVECNFEHEMTEEEVEKYKQSKAVVKVKVMGMTLALPGLIIILYAFR